ncbi:MAG TPA: hypothetical protein VNP98_15700 [Chthoniobacterales bacterium]|nr:hypothetical protein [Chthoniobacterales bacterium]
MNEVIEKNQTFAVTDDKLKYLEFLQAAISRMASNSFLIKGWSVTLGTAVLGFSVKENNWAMALVALIPTGSFWALDAYYLGLERLFRDLWRKAVDNMGATFDMNPGFLCGEQWGEAARRPAVLLVHLPITIASVLAAAVIAFLRLRATLPT